MIKDHHIKTFHFALRNLPHCVHQYTYAMQLRQTKQMCSCCLKLVLRSMMAKVMLFETYYETVKKNTI